MNVWFETLADEAIVKVNTIIPTSYFVLIHDGFQQGPGQMVHILLEGISKLKLGTIKMFNILLLQFHTNQ